MFANGASNDAEFRVTVAQVIKDVTNVGISPQRKYSLIIELKEAVTLPLELRRSSVRFQCKTEAARRVCEKVSSVDTFPDVVMYPERYEFDRSMLLSSAYKSESCGGDTSSEIRFQSVHK